MRNKTNRLEELFMRLVEQTGRQGSAAEQPDMTSQRRRPVGNAAASMR